MNGISPVTKDAFGRRFWLATIGAVVGVAVTVSLGQWQLGRAAQKNAIHASIEERGRLPPIDGSVLRPSSNTAELVHRPVRLRGRWLANRTVFLDNRQMRGTVGFFVMTPLELEPSGAVVVVQRGWVQRDFLDRTRLPEIETPSGTVEVEGRIAQPPSKLFSPGGADTHEGPSRIRQNLDLAEYAAEIQRPLLPLSVLQTGPDGGGLQRSWSPIASGVEKHYGYAFQWFGLAGLIATLYVWFQIVRPFRARKG